MLSIRILRFQIKKSIFIDCMASSEWGPKNVSLDNRRLREVTRFNGDHLAAIDGIVTTYLEENPHSTRNQAVEELAKNLDQAKRIQSGLDVLNQLSVVHRKGYDVRTVIVREDVNNHHYYYDIDWRREPDVT